MKKNKLLAEKIIKLLASIFICLAAGAIGATSTVNSVNSWYTTLIKPSFSPPNWIFGPVWTTLFIMMGIAFFLVWVYGEKKNKLRKPALILFLVHLVFNTLWSIFFFGMQSPLLGFIDIVILWLMIATLAYLFYQVKKPAAYLMLPYLLWVSFASVLNFSILMLN